MKIPQHISIIMDGNGRWAEQRGLERTAGHIEGVKSVHEITGYCTEIGVRYLSIFAFSEENWGRPEQEIGALMKLMFKSMEAEFDTFVKNNVRFRVLGNRSRLPSALNDAIGVLEKATEKNDALDLIVMLSYSGKWDIVQAARQIAASKKAEDICAEDFDKYLVTGGIPDPDLIIRTSGEQRISNYLLWQSAYSEFVFTKTLWPDFRKEQMREALEEYSLRDRRFGKVK